MGHQFSMDVVLQGTKPGPTGHQNDWFLQCTGLRILSRILVFQVIFHIDAIPKFNFDVIEV